MKQRARGAKAEDRQPGDTHNLDNGSRGDLPILSEIAVCARRCYVANDTADPQLSLRGASSATKQSPSKWGIASLRPAKDVPDSIRNDTAESRFGTFEGRTPRELQHNRTLAIPWIDVRTRLELDNPMEFPG